jgi:hypothetical protein
LGSRPSASPDRLPHAELAEERLRCHARDGAEFGDEMRLVVVAGGGMDGRRIREELGFKPKFRRLADAIATGA